MIRKLFLVLTLLTWGFGLQAAVYIVCAGVSDYPGKVNDLRLPAADARTIHELYKINANADSRLLLNGSATKQNILNAIRTQFAKARPGDIAVFFFSGHGYPGGFAAYDGRLPYSEIRKAMKSGHASHKMIFADACYSGKIRDKKTVNSSDENVLAQKSDIMLFLSSRDNEKSYERRTMKNGMFTTYLSLGLRGKADTNLDRTITAKELFNFVHKHVVDISRKKQHPVMWGRFPDNMPVMQW